MEGGALNTQECVTKLPQLPTEGLLAVGCGQNKKPASLEYLLTFFLHQTREYVTYESQDAYPNAVGALCLIQYTGGQLQQVKVISQGIETFWHVDYPNEYPSRDDIKTVTKQDPLPKVFVIQLFHLDDCTIVQSQITKTPIALRRAKGNVIINTGTPECITLETKPIEINMWREDANLSLKVGDIVVILNPKRDVYKERIMFTPSMGRGCLITNLNDRVKAVIKQWFDANPPKRDADTFVPFTAPSGMVFL